MENQGGSEAEPNPDQVSYGTTQLIMQAADILLRESPQRVTRINESPALLTEVALAGHDVPTSVDILVYRKKTNPSQLEPLTHISYWVSGRPVSSAHVALKPQNSGLVAANILFPKDNVYHQSKPLTEVQGRALLQDLSTLIDPGDESPVLPGVTIRLLPNDLN